MYLPAAALVAAAAVLAANAPSTAATSGTAATTGTATTTAQALVFAPNPVQQLGDHTLADNRDADYPALAPAYTRVTLTDLDGSGTLTGTYARVKSNTGKAAVTVNGNFPAWHRDADQFEQVMGYFWVTTGQYYLQHLGFGSTLRPVNQRQIQLRIDQYGVDNPFFTDKKVGITLGKGGVDDAEDGELIMHEYGHSVLDSQVPGIDSPEGAAIHEAFGDYFAVTSTSWRFGPGKTDEPCIADWDSMPYIDTWGPCLRRLDGTKHYPEDIVGEPHRDGEIWSSALYAIRGALGDTLAGQIIIDAQFDYTKDVTFHNAAEQTVSSARRHGGDAAAATVRSAFTARGLL